MELRTIFICLWYISFLIKCSRLQWELSTLNCHLLPFFIWLIDFWLAVHRSMLLPKASRFFKCVHSCVILKSLDYVYYATCASSCSIWMSRAVGRFWHLKCFAFWNKFCFWNKVQNVCAFKICVCACVCSVTPAPGVEKCLYCESLPLSEVESLLSASRKLCTELKRFNYKTYL